MPCIIWSLSETGVMCLTEAKPAGNKDELFIGANRPQYNMTDMINDLIEVEPLMLYAEESDRGVELLQENFCQA